MMNKSNIAANESLIDELCEQSEIEYETLSEDYEEVDR